MLYSLGHKPNMYLTVNHNNGFVGVSVRQYCGTAIVNVESQRSKSSGGTNDKSHCWQAKG